MERLGVKQTAEMFGVTRSGVYYWLTKGLHYKIEKVEGAMDRKVIDPKDVAEFLGLVELPKHSVITPKHRGGKAPKPVRQLTPEGKLIRVWDSIIGVEDNYGLSRYGVMRAATGKQDLYKGFKWEYVEDDLSWL